MKLHKRLSTMLAIFLLSTGVPAFANENTNIEPTEVNQTINAEITTPAILTITMPDYMGCIPDTSLMPKNHELRDKTTDKLLVDKQGNIYDLNGKVIIKADKSVYSPYSGRKLIDSAGYILNEKGERVIAPDGTIDETKVEIILDDENNRLEVRGIDNERAYFMEDLEIEGEEQAKYWYIIDDEKHNVVIANLKNLSGEFYDTINLDTVFIHKFQGESIYTYAKNVDWIFWTEGTSFDYDKDKHAYLKNISSSGSGGGGGSSNNSNNNDNTTELKEEPVKENDTKPVEAVEAALSKEVSQATQAVLKENERVLVNKAVVAEGIKVVINGETIEFKEDILTEQSRLMLPIRPLAEMLKLQVQYNEELKTAIIKGTGGTTLEFPLGCNVAIKNGTEIIQIDAENPEMRTIASNGRTYLPLRFISEQLGLKIDFKDKTVTIQ